MTIKTKLILLCGLLTPGCVAQQDEPTAVSEDRGPLGKADQAGTCAGVNGQTYCGGQSQSGCWCDDECENWGDCCTNRDLVCNPEPEPAANPPEVKLERVRFVDTKAQGGLPVFTIEYQFSGLGEVVVSCNDNEAATTMSGANLANGQTLQLVGGDFYCFRLEQLVNDLADVTGGYAWPSFGGTDSAVVEFDFAGQPVDFNIDAQPNHVTVSTRNSQNTLEFAVP